MKPQWHEAICDAATAGRRFDHADNCQGVTGIENAERCNCAAGAANIALDEIAEGLKTGIPVPLDDNRQPFLCAGGVNVSQLWDEACPKCGATDDDVCKFASDELSL